MYLSLHFITFPSDHSPLQMQLHAPSGSASEFEEGSWDKHLLALNQFYTAPPPTLFLWPLKESFSCALEGAFVKWRESEIAEHHLRKINPGVKMPKGKQLFLFQTLFPSV